MRILFVTTSYPPDSVGGVELHVEGLTRAMTAAGHACHVFARAGSAEVPHLQLLHDQVGGVPVTRMGNTFEDATTFQRLYAHEGIADVFAAELKRIAPDVVHVHHLTCLSVECLERVRAAGIPLVMTLHDFWMGCPRGQRITAGLDLCPEIRIDKCVPCLRELWPHVLGRGRAEHAPPEERDAGDRALIEEYHGAIRQALGAVDQLVTPSDFMRRMFEGYGLEPGSVQVVENGLPVARWRQALAEVDRDGARRDPGSPLRVGFIGSVLPSKGVHLPLEAFRLLGDPSGLRLDVYGEVLPFHHDRTYGDRLEQLRRGHEASITLHGVYRNEDLPRLLAGLDVVVVPSLWYEAYGLTIREAWLAGAVVVTADHGAMAEAVEDGVTGLLFEAGDARSLAACLRRLLDDPALRERLAGRTEWVRDEEAAASELLGVYDRLLGRPGPGREPGGSSPGA